MKWGRQGDSIHCLLIAVGGAKLHMASYLLVLGLEEKKILKTPITGKIASKNTLSYPLSFVYVRKPIQLHVLTYWWIAVYALNILQSKVGFANRPVPMGDSISSFSLYSSQSCIFACTFSGSTMF